MDPPHHVLDTSLRRSVEQAGLPRAHRIHPPKRKT
jgi:hypothetical protein